MAKQLTKDGKYGWVLNYGAPEGIGGVASYWMAFLQQAGGTMYDADGQPAFNNAGRRRGAAGDDGPDALHGPGVHQLRGHQRRDQRVLGRATPRMMLNWPFMWVPANDPASSTIAGQVGAALNPAGPAGTASIDGTDAYTITKLSPDPELAREAHRVLPRPRGPEEPVDGHRLAAHPAVGPERPRGPGQVAPTPPRSWSRRSTPTTAS